MFSAQLNCGAFPNWQTSTKEFVRSLLFHQQTLTQDARDRKISGAWQTNMKSFIIDRTGASLLLVGLLSSCSINPHPMDMTQAVQSARSRADHENLAKHYEDKAKEMQAMAASHKQMLSQYEANRVLYGKQAQNMISHCQGLMRVYASRRGKPEDGGGTSRNGRRDEIGSSVKALRICAKRSAKARCAFAPR